jgi:transcriptional regulator with XRE-family HTH domain
VGRLAWYKQVHGLNLKELGNRMGRHPGQLQEWLNGERRPFVKSLKGIERFMEDDNVLPVDPEFE